MSPDQLDAFNGLLIPAFPGGGVSEEGDVPLGEAGTEEGAAAG